MVFVTETCAAEERGIKNTTAYARGHCRCSACSRAHADYQREYRALHYGAVSADRYDEITIDVVWSLGPPYNQERLSRLERLEIIRRWLRRGGSQRELERLTGWNVSRYLRSIKEA